MNCREHGRHSSASHVHGHSGSRLSAHAAAPSASEPALRALANRLVGLTTARDSSGGVWSNTFLAGAVPGAGPGLGSSLPGAVPVPSVFAGSSASGGVPPVRGLPLPVCLCGGTFTGVAPLEAVSRAFARWEGALLGQGRC